MNVDHLLLVPPNLLKLGEKQRIFVWNQHLFVEFVYKTGYEMTDGESFRTAEQAALNAKKGTGVAKSAHMWRLARDWNLFKDGVYLTDTASHRQFGTFWKTLHPLNRWGGDFSKPDGNHYSMEHEGIQ